MGFLVNSAHLNYILMIAPEEMATFWGVKSPFTKPMRWRVKQKRIFDEAEQNEDERVESSPEPYTVQDERLNRAPTVK